MNLPEDRIPIFAQGYLVEIRDIPELGEPFWQVWASGLVKDLAEKRAHLKDQANRYNRPQNLGELLIVEEETLAENVFGYGEWSD